jgi:hypothetical protein
MMLSMRDGVLLVLLLIGMCGVKKAVCARGLTREKTRRRVFEKCVDASRTRAAAGQGAGMEAKI